MLETVELTDVYDEGVEAGIHDLETGEETTCPYPQFSREWGRLQVPLDSNPVAVLFFSLGALLRRTLEIPMRYMVEIHTGTDVYHNDKHSELGTATRMFERAKLGPQIVAKRLWSSDPARGNWKLIRQEGN